MSSHDIDSTSENVLHDWAREPEDADAEAVSDVDSAQSADGASVGAPAWGTAHDVDASEHSVAVEPDDEVETADADEEDEVADAGEPAEGEIVEEALALELSQEHAAGDLHIPDGYAVLEGVSEGGRRAVGVVVSRFNGSVTTQLLDGALAELSAAGVRPGGDHDHGRPRRVRASARRDRAREDATVRVHRRARLRDPRGHAALRLRLQRSRERSPARRARDGRPGRRSASSRSTASSRRRRASERAPKRCAARSRWPTSSRTCGRQPPLAELSAAARSSYRNSAPRDIPEGARFASARWFRHGVGYSPQPLMSKVCAICGKKPGFGNSRSHSMVATKRRFNPNLQRVRVLLDGRATRAYVCTRCLKAGKVQKAV